MCSIADVLVLSYLWSSISMTESVSFLTLCRLHGNIVQLLFQSLVCLQSCLPFRILGLQFCDAFVWWCLKPVKLFVRTCINRSREGQRYNNRTWVTRVVSYHVQIGFMMLTNMCNPYFMRLVWGSTSDLYSFYIDQWVQPLSGLRMSWESVWSSLQELYILYMTLEQSNHR